MKILAIETSCDETAVTILDISGIPERPDIKVLGNTLLSQIELHKQYGGVYPNLAKREHKKNLPILLEKVLVEVRSGKQEVGLPEDLNCIAVTNGPGLEPALWVGINFAIDLGKKWHKPVIPVNHMEGHIWSVLYADQSSKVKSQKSKLEIPALALLVSGGHTELVHIRDFGNYEILGRTRDDAVGEAFDKTARMLGLSYPGGPEISRLAEKSRQRSSGDKIKFPRPMIHSENLDFSFSGLKTAVLYRLKTENFPIGSQDKSYNKFKENIARAFEDAAIEVLIEKTRRALYELGDEVKTLIVAGGVSANTYLALELKKLMLQFSNTILRIPNKLLTTDNAIMIGIAAFIKIRKKPDILKKTCSITASGNLSLNS